MRWRVSDGLGQDPRHHRRSAARRGTVRGAPSEGRTRSSRKSPARCSSAATTRTSAASRSKPHEEGGEPVEYLIPKGKHIHLQDGDIVEKPGDYIVDGNPAPHDILAIKGVEELAAYLVNEIQEVSPAAGREHQRQAHRGDRSPDAAEGRYRRSRRHRLPDGLGEQVDITEFDAANEKAAGRRQVGDRHAGAARHHQGLLQTRPFISAASFQETTRVLTERPSTARSTRSRA